LALAVPHKEKKPAAAIIHHDGEQESRRLSGGGKENHFPGSRPPLTIAAASRRAVDRSGIAKPRLAPLINDAGGVRTGQVPFRHCTFLPKIWPTTWFTVAMKNSMRQCRC
jgi:hypothetical protein